MAHSVNDVVFKFFLIVTDRQTDRLTTPSVKEMTTPSAKKNSFTLSVVGRYTSTKTFHRNISTQS